MRRWLAMGLVGLAVTGVGGSWLGCGKDKLERGLAPAEEEAVPTKAKDMEETKAERRKKEVEEEQKQTQKLFQEEEKQAE